MAAFTLRNNTYDIQVKMGYPTPTSRLLNNGYQKYPVKGLKKRE